MIMLVTTPLVANYLGPGAYGRFQFVVSVMLLIQVLGDFGLTSYIRKPLIDRPSDSSLILGSAVTVHLCSGILLYVAVLAVVFFQVDDSETLRLFMILGAMVAANGLRGLEHWFHTQTLSKYCAWSTTTALTLGAVAKVLAVIYHAPVFLFALIFLGEFAVTGILFLTFYLRVNTARPRFLFSLKTSQILLAASWPLAISSLSVAICNHSDMVMLRTLGDDALLGQYAVATRLSLIWRFIPVVLSASFAPLILQSFSTRPDAYRTHFEGFTRLMVLIAYTLVGGALLLAPPLIHTLFGDQYAPSIPLLRLHIVSHIFTYLGVARHIHVMGVSAFRYSMVCTAIAAVMNIALNAWWIPILGGAGAALSTTLSAAIAYLLLTAATKTMYPVFRVQLTALLTPWRISTLVELLRNRTIS